MGVDVVGNNTATVGEGVEVGGNQILAQHDPLTVGLLVPFIQVKAFDGKGL